MKFVPNNRASQYYVSYFKLRALRALREVDYTPEGVSRWKRDQFYSYANNLAIERHNAYWSRTWSDVWQAFAWPQRIYDKPRNFGKSLSMKQIKG